MITLAEKYPEIAKEWHPTENGNLRASDVSCGTNKKVWWLCPKSCEYGCLHVYEQSINKKVNGQRCPYCSICPKKICYHQSLAFKYPQHATQWHPTKNGDLTPSKITCHNNQMVWWLCLNKCEYGCLHEYQQIVSDKTKGIGCPWCSKAPRNMCYHQSFEFKYPQHATQWHPTKNGDLTPSKITCHNNQMVWWLCIKCDNDFLQSIKNRSYGRGCSFCKNKTELKLYDIIIPIYPNILTQFKQEWCKNISYLPFDFCIPEYKIIIELDGPQHFQQVSNWASPEEQFENDKYKEKCANENEYSVIRILQEDVFYDTYNWFKELCESIEKLKNNNKVANIYLCKNKEYHLYTKIFNDLDMVT